MTIYDITLPISPELVVWPGDPPIEVSQVMQLARGDVCTLTHVAMSAHTGTHLDAPAHFILGGGTVESLDLNLLMGPALVVDVGDAAAVTAVTLNALNIPPNTERLLLKSKNSARWAVGESSFYMPFVAIEADGAQWLVDHGVKLVGVDYLSIAPFHDVEPTHKILLGAEVIAVEGLNLHGIVPGAYELICLPMKIADSDGAPVRAVLISGR
ncbi:MAG: cyclase family protein [Anaerolineales bacterium]|nr:cyclase family protein [Anaerolineales bacterium]